MSSAEGNAEARKGKAAANAPCSLHTNRDESGSGGWSLRNLPPSTLQRPGQQGFPRSVRKFPNSMPLQRTVGVPKLGAISRVRKSVRNAQRMPSSSSVREGDCIPSVCRCDVTPPTLPRKRECESSISSLEFALGRTTVCFHMLWNLMFLLEVISSEG